MQKILLATAISSFIFVTGSVRAGDIYAPAGFKDAPYIAAPTWTGFYVGAHVGGAWSSLKVTDTNGWMYGCEFAGQYPCSTAHTGIYNESFQNDSSGVFGGGQIGYNFQSGNLIYGVEADLGGMGIAHNVADPYNPDFIFSHIGNGFYGDLTGRLGYAWGGFLAYAKGGFAFLDASASLVETHLLLQTNNTSTFTGWTVGGGIEYAITPAWSVKAEYLHFDFGNEDVSWTYGDGNFPWRHELTVDTFKAGINWHVGPSYSLLK